MPYAANMLAREQNKVSVNRFQECWNNFPISTTACTTVIQGNFIHNIIYEYTYGGRISDVKTFLQAL